MVRLFCVVAILLSLTACDPASKYSKQISEIDSCMTVLDTIELRYYEIDFNGLDSLVKNILQNEADIKKYYVSDTIYQDLAKNLNKCKGIRKYFGDVKKDQIEFHEEIKALKGQFENLKTDISNGTLKEDQMNQYLTNEKSDLDLLNRSFSEFYERYEKALVVEEVCLPMVDNFVKELKANRDSIPL